MWLKGGFGGRGGGGGLYIVISVIIIVGGLILHPVGARGLCWREDPYCTNNKRLFGGVFLCCLSGAADGDEAIYGVVGCTTVAKAWWENLK